ncbi:MAG: 50S ribosome-binding GTPase, partial [Deltaproteobacteria bacterium]|nr:50S ribosome-binding GTPase [Deltaproteobacteria bacterium]
ERIQKWLEDYETGRLIREGLVVALVGKPNVGKSSLLNRMLNEEAAIVHHVPGTTRDPIERPIQLGGFSLRLVDTAGIREASDYVEQKGIERSKDWIEKSDLILALFDRSCPLEDEDIKIFEAASKKKCLFLFNKSDLKACWSLEDFLKFFSPFNISLSERQVISISTKTEEGIVCLEKSIPQLFGIDSLENQEILYLNQVRHKNALLKALNALDLALKNLSSYSVEFIATDIRVASEALGEIVGEISTEDVLEDIFSRFCIGK